ncbi:hypothetical protein T492DRAFT_1125637 [Pavlovales sp. CCMP2436]|nr:hypothetical protein T492DRAFT_1125637 [Pavlovales sp. CCMP2436]
MNGYGHYMPYAEPGWLFDLVGYLVVSPSLVRARETRVLNLASKQNGWETQPRDKEWRRWLGAPGDVHVAIAKLLAALRTTVDGLWYTFKRGTGRILRQGSSHISHNQDLVLPLIPNVLTRSLWGCNMRWQASRHEMKVRTRIGVVVDDQAPASITCEGCSELKTPNEMNHRRRRTGEITVTDKCCHCYRMQARMAYRPETQRNIDIFSELFEMYAQPVPTYGPSTRRGFKSVVHIDYKGKERRIPKTQRGFETLERRVAREYERLNKQTLTSFFGRKSNTIRDRF